MKEPTAWLNKERDVITFDNLFPEMTPLYEKREWVGLTEDEVSKIIDEEIGFNSCWGPEEAFARAIEAKLKEKNT